MLNLSADLLENLAKKIRKKAGKNPKKTPQKIQPKEENLETKFLAEFALCFWRLNSRLKTHENLNADKPLNSAINRIYELLNAHKVEIKDYTNVKFNEGLNVDVIECERVEISPNDDKSEMILQTLSPSIIINGEICKKAKIIKESKILKEQK